ncbi:hypothetical protein LXA43DRAFT_138150 [Ganoderma leucocontextum]|nr:hypothetical protein LXA43DRAFT_138150 [Ganoderma leucocontextum]
MSAGNISTIHIPDEVPRALSQTVDGISPSGPNKLFAWLFDQTPLILGSALGMFASNIFLYACRTGRLSTLWRVSLHALSSLRDIIHLITTVAPKSICGICVWTCQLARHIYLLALCALCQAVILPCLVGSECLRCAGLAWFGTLRILYTTLRILSMVVFYTLVVDTGLDRAFVFALGTVTSFLSWVWDSSTDLHDAAIDFVCGPQSTLLRCHSHRADEPGASKASPRRSTLPSLPETIQTTIRLERDLGLSGTKWRATAATGNSEAETAHEGTRFRVPVRTTLRLPLALTDQLESRAIDITSSPGEVDVLRPSETNGARTRCRIDVPGSDRNPGGGNSQSTEASPGKETVAGRPTNARGKGRVEERYEGKNESYGNETTSVPSDNTRNVPTPINAPQLRLPVTSPAFWCPPGVAGADAERLEAAEHRKTVWSPGVCSHERLMMVCERLQEVRVGGRDMDGIHTY